MEPLSPNMWVRYQTPPPAPDHPGILLSQQILFLGANWRGDAIVQRKVPTEHGATTLLPLEELPIERLVPVAEQEQPPTPSRALHHDAEDRIADV